MSENSSQVAKLVIRQTADNAEVTAVPCQSSDLAIVAQIAENIRKSLLPGYYLDYPAKSAGQQPGGAA